MKFEAFEYYPSEKEEISSSKSVLLYLFLFMMIGGLIIIGFVWGGIIVFVVTVFFLLIIYPLLWTVSILTFEKLSGRIGDKICITETNIKVRSEVFQLNAVKILDIGFGDFFGRRKYKFHFISSYGLFEYEMFYQNILDRYLLIIPEACFSRGYRNYITFKHEDIIYKIQFILDSVQHVEEFKNVIGQFVKTKALTCEKGINLVDLKNYEEVQEFKKKYCEPRN